MTVPAVPMTSGLARRLSGHPLLLLLDIDGTLSPIAPRPEQARTPPETQDVLRGLVALPGVYVAVVTGRSADDGRRLVGVNGIWVIGNHGLEVAQPGEPPDANDQVRQFADAIAAAVAECRSIATSEPGIIVEDKRWTASVHYRLADPVVVPQLTARVEDIAGRFGLWLTHGKQVLELRPPVEVNKGTAAKGLASRLRALTPAAALLCAGDDQTDEDAFRVLREAQPSCVTVRVGDDAAQTTTCAEFGVPDTLAMREMLLAVDALHRGKFEVD